MIDNRKLLYSLERLDTKEDNKLNTSFTKYLTDSIKENVLKLRNPKMIKPNKEKEINKALKEIKENKGTTSEKSKKGPITTEKNKKKVKISNEPLFKDNKRKDHTIIHNRNASAINNETRGKRKNEDDIQIKSKKKKESSVSKFETKNLKSVNNIDLKNNMKRIKKETNKDKEKEKDKSKDNKDKKEKERKNETSTKKTNISITKRNSKDDKTKKSAIYLKKINSKPAPSSIKKSINTSSAYTLNTTSHSKPIKNSNSNFNKYIMKTPSKNLNKTHFESLYKNGPNSNANINKNETQNNNGNLNQTIELRDAKKKKQKNQ